VRVLILRFGRNRAPVKQGGVTGLQPPNDAANQQHNRTAGGNPPPDSFELWFHFMETNW